MIKIGILNADPQNPDIIQRFGDYPSMFQRLFEAACAAHSNKPSFHRYAVYNGEYPSDVNDCDAYLLTGSKASVYDAEPWIAVLEDYVRQLHAQKKMLIGICFGHQLIAQALGGSTAKSEKGWGVGVRTCFYRDDAGREDSAFSLLYSHQDQVQRLPESAQLLASDEFCAIAAYQLGQHILSFQGHPEFTPAYSRFLLDKRRQLIGEKTYLDAIASLDKNTDHLSIARWILDFIQQH